MVAFRPILILALLTSGCSSGSDVGANNLRTALITNPDLVLEVLKQNERQFIQFIHEASEREHKRQVHRKRLADLEASVVPVIDSTRAVRGDENAPITIVVYSDFQCPYSARAARTLAQLQKSHPFVRIIVKQYPLSFHRQAVEAAMFFEAISNQDVGKAWLFHDLLYEDQERIKEGGSYFRNLANKLNVNMAVLEKDLASESLRVRMETDRAEAFVLGVSSTPTFNINGIWLNGLQPTSEFEDIFQMVLGSDKH